MYLLLVYLTLFEVDVCVYSKRSGRIDIRAKEVMGGKANTFNSACKN